MSHERFSGSEKRGKIAVQGSLTQVVGPFQNNVWAPFSIIGCSDERKSTGNDRKRKVTSSLQLRHPYVVANRDKRTGIGRGEVKNRKKVSSLGRKLTVCGLK